MTHFLQVAARIALEWQRTLHLAALRHALACGVPRDELAAGVCAVAMEAGDILETASC